MIHHLDETLRKFLNGQAPDDSLLKHAKVDFSPPSSTWKANLATGLTLNCYLYDVRENSELRRAEPYLAYNSDRSQAARRRPPARIDCRYCITAWSGGGDEFEVVLDEHRLLSEVLQLLLASRSIPAAYWEPSLADQLPPYPTLVAEPDALKSQPDFWTAFNQQPRPSLTYLVTLALSIDETEPATHVVGSGDDDVRVNVDHRADPAAG